MSSAAVIHTATVAAQTAVQEDLYRIAAGDRITVTVLSQTELSGDYTVDGVGNVTLPLVGAVKVADTTVDEAQQVIADRLRQGILRHPAVAVRIAEFRPVYVLGDVRTPGSYPFRHGSTVRSIVALAGGFGANVQPYSVAIADFLAADERAKLLMSTRQSLRMRQARLEAMRDGKDFAVGPPMPELEESEYARLFEQEKDVYQSLVDARRQQLSLISAQKPRIAAEIGAVNAQIVIEKKQAEQVKEQLAEYDKLTKSGLSRRVTVIERERELSRFEGNQFKLSADLARLQQMVGDLEIRLQDIEINYRKAILSELLDTRQKLIDTELTLTNAREIRDLRLQQTGGFAASQSARSVVITRARGKERLTITGNEDTMLQSGDIVEIKWAMPQGQGHTQRGKTG